MIGMAKACVGGSALIGYVINEKKGYELERNNLSGENPNELFVEKISAINNHYLQEVDKKNKVHRPLHYLILILLTMLLVSCITIVFLRDENSDLKNRVEWYMQQETKKGDK